MGQKISNFIKNNKEEENKDKSIKNNQKIVNPRNYIVNQFTETDFENSLILLNQKIKNVSNYIPNLKVCNILNSQNILQYLNQLLQSSSTSSTTSPLIIAYEYVLQDLIQYLFTLAIQFNYQNIIWKFFDILEDYYQNQEKNKLTNKGKGKSEGSTTTLDSSQQQPISLSGCGNKPGALNDNIAVMLKNYLNYNEILIISANYHKKCILEYLFNHKVLKFYESFSLQNFLKELLKYDVYRDKHHLNEDIELNLIEILDHVIFKNKNTNIQYPINKPKHFKILLNYAIKNHMLKLQHYIFELSTEFSQSRKSQLHMYKILYINSGDKIAESIFGTEHEILKKLYHVIIKEYVDSDNNNVAEHYLTWQGSRFETRPDIIDHVFIQCYFDQLENVVMFTSLKNHFVGKLEESQSLDWTIFNQNLQSFKQYLSVNVTSVKGIQNFILDYC
jgi:hypothetical protein